MLSSKVSEIMTTQVTSAPVSATIRTVMETMVAEDVGRVIIHDNDRPVGIFTERHVLRMVANPNLDSKTLAVADVMTSPIRGVGHGADIVDALAEMLRGKIRHLQVYGDSGEVIGIVSMRRILAIAVELGQGLSEHQNIGGILLHGALAIDESAPVADAIDLMIQKDASAVVVTAVAKPVGIFTERDVLTRVVDREIDCNRVAVKNVMTSPLATMPTTALVGEVLAEMYRRDIRNMPVVGEGGELSGLVSMADVLQYARAFNIQESVRKTWREIQNFYDSDDQFTPG
jgi:signal-transduction protein with cAMP-binding, CBS, and nucleotidyltransferase domain